MSDTLTKEYMERTLDSFPVAPEYSRRLRHECGDGLPLLISGHKEATKFYCFRCGARGSLPKVVSLKDRVDIAAWRGGLLGAVNAQRRTSGDVLGYLGALPQQWPREARLWLARYGISHDAAWNRNIRWSDKLQRLLFMLPEFDAWCARRLLPGDPGPKYLMPAGSQAYAFYIPHKKYQYLQQRLVVCEDALSAVKVAEAGHFGLSLLGTKLHAPAMQKILDVALQVSAPTLPTQIPPVVVWMDQDAAGNSAASSLAPAIRMFAPVKVLRGHGSPKENHLEHIVELLKEQE